MAQVCDFSSPQDLGAVAAHYAGIVRYASDYTPKNITAAELADARSRGLTVTIVVEQGNQPALRGAAGGTHDALVANTIADHVGYDPRAYLLAVGEDPNVLPQSAWPTVVAYFVAFVANSKRPVGGYGSYGLLAHLHGLGLIAKGWMVETWNAGAPAVLPAWIVLEQLVGVNTYGLDVDADSVLQTDYGQQPRPAQPNPSTGGENMLSYKPDQGSASWALGPDGGVFPADGAPFLGSMANNRFGWEQLGTLAGISPWYDAVHKGWSFKIAVHLNSGLAPDGSPFDYFRFPSDGSLAKVVAGVLVDDLEAVRFEETDEGKAYLATAA